VRAAIPALTPQQVATFTDMAMRDVASRGLTTVTEGDTTASQWRLLMEAEAHGALTADVVAYANDTQAAMRGMAMRTSARNVADTMSGAPGRLRLAGLAFWTSRAAGTGTGWRSPSPTAPFHDAAHGPHAGRLDPTRHVRASIDTWYATRHQILVHVDGDTDADAVLTAIDAAQKTHGVDDRRPILVQCGQYRDDHLAAMQAMGVIPSFSPTWPADAIGRCSTTPGEAQGQRRAAMAAVAGRGMPYTIHGDGTFEPRDVLRVVGATVSQPAPPRADDAGPEPTVTPYQALLSVTRHAAFALFEEGRKGTLEPGKRADLVILERNPLKVEPAAIGEIRVLQTIKDGVTVYRAH
jgi:predicted amidohydrolase YtcJ